MTPGGKGRPTPKAPQNQQREQQPELPVIRTTLVHAFAWEAVIGEDGQAELAFTSLDGERMLYTLDRENRTKLGRMLTAPSIEVPGDAVPTQPPASA